MRAITHADFLWRVKFAGAGDAAFSELADQIFVRTADDIQLDIVESQALLTDALDQITQAVIVEISHTVGGRVEINPVDNPFKQSVLIGNLPQIRSQFLPEFLLVFVFELTFCVFPRSDNRPNGVPSPNAIVNGQGQKRQHGLVNFVVIDVHAHTPSTISRL
ncbi:MAG TPA: hypothetical protein VLX11_09330 [Candidatus Acidoferrales bacterium]|nr:hypothetical protein [Candidatus Acidoferrales bacterium]